MKSCIRRMYSPDVRYTSTDILYSSRADASTTTAVHARKEVHNRCLHGEKSQFLQQLGLTKTFDEQDPHLFLPRTSLIQSYTYKSVKNMRINGRKRQTTRWKSSWYFSRYLRSFPALYKSIKQPCRLHHTESSTRDPLLHTYPCKLSHRMLSANNLDQITS